MHLIILYVLRVDYLEFRLHVMFTVLHTSPVTVSLFVYSAFYPFKEALRNWRAGMVYRLRATFKRGTEKRRFSVPHLIMTWRHQIHLPNLTKHESCSVLFLSHWSPVKKDNWPKSVGLYNCRLRILVSRCLNHFLKYVVLYFCHKMNQITQICG